MLRPLLYSALSAGSREVKAYERESCDPRTAQTARLLEMVSSNAATVYGREHGFAGIRTISDLQKAVPINVYDSLQPYVERTAAGEQNILTAEQPFMFATTSGTTGARKLIPVTRSYVKEFRKASVVSGYNLLKNFPGIAKGVSLSVFSQAEEGRTSGNIPYGAISGPPVFGRTGANPKVYFSDTLRRLRHKRLREPVLYASQMRLDAAGQFLIYAQSEHDRSARSAIGAVC